MFTSRPTNSPTSPRFFLACALPPTVKVMFTGSGGEGDVPVSIPLSWNFEPQHHYTLTIRISTWYLFLYVQGSDWDSEASIDYTFGVDPYQTIYLDGPLWETGNGGGQTGTI